MTSALLALDDAQSKYDEAEALRKLSRSPHPYHQLGTELWKEANPYRSPDRFYGDTLRAKEPPSLNGQKVDHTHTPISYSDSGTEADDESFGVLKGLPAPPLRPRKGLKDSRGADVHRPDSPLLTPSQLHDLNRELDFSNVQTGKKHIVSVEEDRQREYAAFRKRRRRELGRRCSEACLLCGVGAVVVSGDNVREAARPWQTELRTYAFIIFTLFAIYPFRILLHTGGATQKRHRFGRLQLPSIFDPAPILYPLCIPIYVALSLLPKYPGVLLPNIVLGLSAIPAPLIPDFGIINDINVLHWMITISPLLISQKFSQGISFIEVHSSKDLMTDFIFFLYPLHQALLSSLYYLTTTSLLSAELQLLSIALINLLLLASSPQALILKALLWVGGLGIFIFCRHVLEWGVTLARVPRWRLRRAVKMVSNSNSFFQQLRKSLQSHASGLLQIAESDGSDDSSGDDILPTRTRRRQNSLRDVGIIKIPNGSNEQDSISGATLSAVEPHKDFLHWINKDSETPQRSDAQSHRRRHTLSTFTDIFNPRLTPVSKDTRRRRKSPPAAFRVYLSLTPAQAKMRKWIYAAYVYVVVSVIILIGVRSYVAQNALYGMDPVGWALGFLFGDDPSFRNWTRWWKLEPWIALPERNGLPSKESCRLGWVEHIRRDVLGEAYTRLLICAYWIGILIVGMAVVLRLTAVVEVDTRRKIFHGMMVGMFLPATYIDPAFAYLALELILAVFLLLDLLRASQLPPISKPLAYFLTPYVDGRDLRGPVVVSHIFLLIGCAIPLWLSMADMARAGESPWRGWEVESRSVCMVSGVICVGMGDAAASLIGRRFGRRKWPWAGGKSLEGSIAFTVAVTIGLIYAKIWLLIGRWNGVNNENIVVTLGKAVAAASGASFTEAVLTGGNDNVIVPVVLWLLVKGLDL